MKNKHPSLLPLFILFSLVICNCDLLTGPKMDLFQQISDEVDWANAAKLTVRVEYPPAWGMSNPAQGTITPAKDIRKGYAFDIEFIPDVVWSFNGWRAYRSSSLPANWTTEWAANPSLLDDLELARLDGVSVAVPDLPARGGTGSLTINTTENITLVPWCKSEPYVTRTIPRDSPAASYPRGTDIVIYFNTPLSLAEGKALDTLFTTGTISITGDGDDFTGMYNPPVYAANDDGTYTITISPSDVPGGKLIVVSVGPGIANRLGTLMSKAEVFSFRTQSSSSGGSITSWEASYTGNTITVGWEISKANESDEVEVKARYRVNQGGDNNLADDKTIRGVNEPDASGVTEGRSVNGIREYEIFLDLYIEGVKSNTASTSFKIWNFPGMVNVSNTNPVIEIGEEADLNRIRTSGLGGANKDKKYVLVKDVAISGVWTPIGSGLEDDKNTNTTIFLGSFYGAGRTITLKNGFSFISATVGSNTGPTTCNYGGVFGSLRDALIRDLTVVYHNTHTTGTGARFYYVGGIAGYAGGSTKILNCTVRGANETATLEAGASNTVKMGGIAGEVIGSSYIRNCRAALNVTLSGEGDNSGFLGGVVGQYSTSSTMADIKSVAVVSLSREGTNSNDGVCGGITGVVNEASITRCVFSGKINILQIETRTDVIVGGLVGEYIVSDGQGTYKIDYDDSSVTFCEMNGELNMPGYEGSGMLRMGGIFGFVGSDRNNINLKRNLRLKNLTSKDGIILLNFTARMTNSLIDSVGGFAGYVTSHIIFENCRSDLRSITVSSKENREIDVGGFAGHIERGSIADCSSSTSVIVPPENIAGIRTGGFCGRLENIRYTVNRETYNAASKLERCYATGNVSVSGIGTFYAGGLVGGSSTSNNSPLSNTITQCYATGNVIAKGLSTSYVGGLVGNATDVNISETYAVGSVTARISGRSYAGGLAGYLYGNSSVDNCYATGDVTADNLNTSADAVYAGGLVGYMAISNSVIRSFASGTVSAKNASSSADVYAGGVVGYINYGAFSSDRIERCVAAGRPGKKVSVSAQGGNNRYVGRIYGGTLSLYPNPAASLNYANTAIYTGMSASYYVDPVLTASVGGGTPTNNNGGDITPASLAGENFWTGTSSNINFSADNWNFFPVLQGWPVLKNAGGNQ